VIRIPTTIVSDFIPVSQLDSSRSVLVEVERDFTGAPAGSSMGDRAAILTQDLLSGLRGFAQDGAALVTQLSELSHDSLRFSFLILTRVL
jgi:hypothetical protein